MLKRIFSIFFVITVTACAYAADPMATDYTYDQCQGSLMPYPLDTDPTAYPDHLTPVMINHVGRHGARFPASASHTQSLRDALIRAADKGTITDLGKKLFIITDKVIEQTNGQWGALDSLGQYEQRIIASRMYSTFKPVFNDCRVMAMSSYSPRAMMSMYAFTHQLDRLNNHIEFTTTTGRENSMLLRPFDLDADFKDFLQSEELKTAYDTYFINHCPITAIARVLGNDFPYKDDSERRDLAISEYFVLAGLAAMSIDCDLSKYFTVVEINALWSCFNLRQYLQRSATSLSMIPAEIASDLLLNLINTTDSYIDGNRQTNVILRFGHAETLIPLFALMHLPGCYYMTNYFDTVAKHWCDFDIVPMAANLQMILFYDNNDKGYYLRIDLNEKPVTFIPNDPRIYVPWKDARAYLMKCVPFYAQ